MGLVIENLPLEALKEYENNAKLHPDEQVAQIAASIEAFGFNDPIAVDENGVIIEGHGRLLAARRLGLTTVPVIRLAHLSETQKRAYILAHNKLTLNSGFDVDLLAAELAAIRDDGFDVALTGFDAAQLDAYFRAAPAEPEGDPDDAPGPPEEPITQPGDLYEIGPHRLMCGDSTVETTAEKLMANRLADMLLSDPPYGVAYVGKTKDALEIQNDALDEVALTQLVEGFVTVALAHCRPGAYWYATVPARPLHLIFARVFKENDLLRQIMVWVKDSMVLGHSEYHYRHEPILFGWKPGGERHKNHDRTRTTVWEYARPKANREHPTMKPVDLWSAMLLDGSREGEIVYDPFLGSGTTMVAAQQTGRVCYGMEIDPKYCDVIVARMRKLWPSLEVKRNGSLLT